MNRQFLKETGRLATAFVLELFQMTIQIEVPAKLTTNHEAVPLPRNILEIKFNVIFRLQRTY